MSDLAPTNSPTPATPASTRRDFLAKAAAVAGTTALGAFASAAKRTADLPQDRARGSIPTDRPIRMGIIGTGGMGGGHINAVVSLTEKGRTDARIVAVSDVCKPRLDNARKVAADRQGIDVASYRDYTDLLARGDIDAVLIASPEHWHAQMAEDAIASGKDVYLEKPMTLRLDDALRLRALMDANPHMRLQVGTQYMMDGKYRSAKKLIAEGAIGHATFSQTSYCRNSIGGEWLYGIDENVAPGEMLDWEAWCGPLGLQPWDTEVYHRWRRYSKFSTGIIGDLLVHQMTPLLYALDVGWPVRVTASGGHYIDKAMDNHDQVNLTVEFEKEHTMIVAGSTCNEQGLEVMVRGHEANLYLGGNDCVLRPERIFVDDIDAKTYNSPGVNSQDELRLDWLNAVRTRQMNISTVELASRIMVIVDLATRSIWEGSAFTFDPATLKVSRA